MPLTDIAIRKAKPTTKAQRLFDERGLYLEVATSGGKLWRLKYRFDGKEKRLALGSYPDTTLADARGKRDEARRLLANGVDPNAHRKAAKVARIEAAANSFEVVAREWLSKQQHAASTAVKVIAWFEKNVFPWIGSRPVAELGARDFLDVLRRVEQRGAVESAHRIKFYCQNVMAYAIATSRAERNPVLDITGALAKPAERHHAAIIDPSALGALLRAIDGYKTGNFPTLCALRLAPLVFLRASELCRAEWSEIDLDAGEWNIPAARMKVKTQPHLVPLSTQAIAILRELHPVTGAGRYLFPNSRTPHNGAKQRPMTEEGLLAALRRLGYSKDEMTIHGFRATARTLLDETLGYRPDYIEHQLAHAVRDPHGRAYNRTSHLHERRKMMQGWADYLETLRTGANVVQIRSASRNL